MSNPKSTDPLLFNEAEAAYGVTTCLGKSFKSDEERRIYFSDLLREKLQDPDFRKIEGFPIGSDEDIIRLSDPPYYTACPNPWIVEIISQESNIQNYNNSVKYERVPFATDLNEGKSHPIYNAHSYHTKVPHRAIMRYILHYTEPGDTIFDGFCGTGMTGVAAELCGNREEVLSLGYQINSEDTILKEVVTSSGEKQWQPFSKLGKRYAILNDLSPAASFISYNYNSPLDIYKLSNEFKKILKDAEKECGWVYETMNPEGRICKINYIIWSDIFICQECSNEFTFWDTATDKESGKVLSQFPCPSCSSKLNKRNIDRAWINKYDEALGKNIKIAKQAPVLISYFIGNKQFQKIPDKFDFDLISKIESFKIPYWFPTNPLHKGDKTSEPLRFGITNAHHFYTKRNLYVLSCIWDKLNVIPRSKIFITSILVKTGSLLHNIGVKNGRINLAGALPNTLFIPSNLAERNLFFLISGKIKDFNRVNFSNIKTNQIISVGSLSSPFFSELIKDSIDYVFVDPPFGSNLQYSDLSFLWESWFSILTNKNNEAIESKTQKKGLTEYKYIMTNCFKQVFNILKPGHWMTVEFSSTKASVWTNIQAALSDAGFVVGNVSSLKKGQGTFNSQTNPTSVKQDLIISAYKPNGGFEERFENEAQSEQGVWDFIETHLKYISSYKIQNNTLQFIPERDPRILFDQMVAYYVRKGFNPPISSQDFQSGLNMKFIEIDGMYFLPEQAAEFSKMKIIYGANIQTSLFVSDESTAIQWLRVRLKSKPQIISDIQPDFMPLLSHLNKNEKELINLELLLDQNFLKYDGEGPVPDQIHSYLSSNWREYRNLPKDNYLLINKAKDRWYLPDPNKQNDLDRIREKSLLREFEVYFNSNKRLKHFRLEIIRSGFKKAWQERNYAKIVKVAGLIPNNVIESDPKLYMWYDQSITRLNNE